ncbi:MAG TPA: hypothetical protein VFQ66_00385 [Candidatus Limnocylindria bacterium]|nr:hypothetical protein [Candidatus Limnocylindria bacterium]
MIWTAARVLAIVLAVGVLFMVPLYSQASDGTTQLLTDGVVIDAVAIVVIVASAWSLLRDRRRS